MKQTSEKELLELAIKNLQYSLTSRTVPQDLPNELTQLEGYVELQETLLDIRRAIMAIATGNLSYKITTKGYLAGAIKTLQASLSHLTWQTKMMASGDFSQRVDFMGEFSEAFNSMAKQLEESTKKLERMARIDSLTGLNNRRYFMELLTIELDRAQRYNRNFSLIVLDLDDFKLVNDNQGHAAGDEVLRSIKQIFANSGLRNYDFYGRIGGEEFSLVLPETVGREAILVAERIRQEFENTNISYEGRHLYVTASIGIGEYRTGDTAESLIKRADEAMYKAKASGRNKVFRTP
ncbi:diguanylate cyclase (GGDEF) domain-containing protein [Desulfuromusa kysingii]|uniref:diguanylate cyclase n=1 Tax=Desulfuromusa kysingii TaxID=37625 RepID=A0A1H4DGF5_9BACT|nr:GGDEF domain-containing protein [Desulfuromusa kysingii]SEA71638.1 diguanylate cyclase (GGDEF) domain-containing protein [Desulfuromusa kysingii]